MIRADDEKWLPQGADSIQQTRKLTESVMDIVQAASTETGSCVRIDIETTPKASGGTDVVGLIICDTDTGRTAVVPMKLSPALVRLRKALVYLGHSGGAANLFTAVWSEVREFIEADANMAESPQ